MADEASGRVVITHSGIAENAYVPVRSMELWSRKGWKVAEGVDISDPDWKTAGKTKKKGGGE